MSASRRVSLVVLAAAVIVGGWLRFASLGRLSPWDDEFPHMIAGRATVASGSPTLPSGRSYRRALAQTIAVGASMKIFGDGEAAARVPSAVAGLATIPVVFLLVRRRFGEAVAAAAAAGIAISPVFVAHSRSARFYAAFVLVYIASAWFASHAIRTGRRAHIASAIVLFLLALHLQSLAVLIVVPVVADAIWCRATGTPDERRRATAALKIAATAAVAGGVALGILALTGGGSRLVDFVRLPVPGVEFSPALRLHTLGRVFNGMTPWAWLVLGPAALVALRRARSDGAPLLLHAIAPALVLSLLYKRIGTHPRGIDVRYLVHLRLLIFVVAAIGAVQLLRWIVRSDAMHVIAAVAIAIAGVAGVSGVLSIPNERHPGTVIPRANWRAAAEAVRAELRADDGLLTTSPLASSWFLGRCGTWLRSHKVAAPYVDGGRDVYCGTSVVSSFADTQALMRAFPSGWVLADAWWQSEVDASVRSFIEARMRRVPSPDATVLIYRWGAV